MLLLVIKICKEPFSAQLKKLSLMKKEKERGSLQSKLRIKLLPLTSVSEEQITNFRRQQHRKSSLFIHRMQLLYSQQLNLLNILKLITLKLDMKVM
jgi:hypothetical protein